MGWWSSLTLGTLAATEHTLGKKSLSHRIKMSWPKQERRGVEESCSRAAGRGGVGGGGGGGGSQGVKQTSKYSENQRRRHSHKRLHARRSSAAPCIPASFRSKKVPPSNIHEGGRCARRRYRFLFSSSVVHNNHHNDKKTFFEVH